MTGWMGAFENPSRATVAPLLTRRRALAGCLGVPFMSGVAAAATFDPERPVPVTAEDIAWFRTCRAAWDSGEGGAPGIVPDGHDVNDYLTRMIATPPSGPGHPDARRLEPILCAVFLNARFDPGQYRLHPPVRPEDGWNPGAALPDSIEVRPEHIALLQHSSWAGSFMDDKRPYGGSTAFEDDMARILGDLPPVAAKSTRMLTPAEEAHYQAVQWSLLLVVQAYIQHAAIEPGRYALPRDGWRPTFRPRCRPLPPGQLARYQAFCAAHPGTGEPGHVIDNAVQEFAAKAALLEP